MNLYVRIHYNTEEPKVQRKTPTFLGVGAAIK